MREDIKLTKANEETLALEMLRELKSQNKRQHITIIVLIAVIISMVIGFFIFANQFEIVGETEQVIEDVNNSTNSTYTQQSN